MEFIELLQHIPFPTPIQSRLAIVKIFYLTLHSVPELCIYSSLHLHMEKKGNANQV